jgi:hypothetical protein
MEFPALRGRSILVFEDETFIGLDIRRSDMALRSPRVSRPPTPLQSRHPVERIATAIDVPRPVIVSICRSFAMISSGLFPFPIVVLQLTAQAIPRLGPPSR